MSEQSKDFLNDYARTLIRVKARQLSRRKDFNDCQAEDIQQDLILHILTKLDRFDPKRASLNTFLATVVNSAVAMMIRSRSRIKRNGGDGVETTSLDQVVDLSDGTAKPIGATLSEADAKRRRGGRFLSDEELVELRTDVESVLLNLPENLQRVCHLLMTQSRPEALRQSKLTHRQFATAIRQIREQFTKSGLSFE
jgi:RNA polymerase sigma factor (sigma-70 family)